MPGIQPDNFGFENPNFDSSSEQKNKNKFEGEEEELNNSLDLFYERNDTVWISSTTGTGFLPHEQSGHRGLGDDNHSVTSRNRESGDYEQKDRQFDVYVTKNSIKKDSPINDKNVKRRYHYARMGMGDMGIPLSPSIDGDSEANRAVGGYYSSLSSRSGDSERYSATESKKSNSDEEIVEEIQEIWYKHKKEEKEIRKIGDQLIVTTIDSSELGPEGTASGSDTGGPSNVTRQRIFIPNEKNKNTNTSPRYLIKTFSSSATPSTQNYRHYRSLDNLSVDVGHHPATTMYSNGSYPHQNGHQRQTPHDDSAIDYSPHDFRRSFAAIDHAAKYSGQGLRMKKELDDGVTIVTEHRDPYSFYWQLDKVRKEEEPPRRDEIVTENVIEEIAVEESTQVQSPDSHDSGIHVEYSKPVKPIIEKFTQQKRDESPKKRLPPGWERHQDPSGYSYYWHVDSGTVQREPPKQMADQRVHVEREPKIQVAERPRPSVSQAVQVQTPAPVVYPPQQPVIIERAFKQTTTKRRIENDVIDDRDEIADDGGPKTPVRFAVRSLGWTEIAEEDLTPERSSRAVNKAIVDLSMGRNDLIDNVSKWGDGKELIMELDDHDLRLMDPDSGTVLHTQPIHQIRVWGVGRDNGRDFAYVARDRNTRRFMCHVFRCDTPARTIANTLRDICKRLMMERRPTTLQTVNGTSRENRQSNGTVATTGTGSRPGSRFGAEHVDTSTGRRSVARDPFPTPMEEPKKVIRCHFLGVTQVPRATGIEILNEAVDRLVAQVRTERWILVDVSIAPSTITVTEVGGNQIAECRVRYLSFLGIGRDIKHCAFIMHTSADNFMCYVFHVEPSAGAMAKTIEAACKLRYQKVLDSHGERRVNGSKGISDTIRNVFGNITGRRPSRTQHNPA